MEMVTVRVCGVVSHSIWQGALAMVCVIIAGCDDSTSPAIASQLTFVTQPPSASVDWTLVPDMIVAATAADGQTAVSWSDSVTLSLESGDGTAELLGTTTRAPVAGVAVFDDLSVDASGSSYRLVARSGTLTEASSEPFMIHDVFSATVVTTGFSHTCALTTDSEAYCWGSNDKGQLGDGTTDARSLPTPVITQLRFAAITAGGRHTCGLTSDGSAYCWGSNEAGQLGNGTTDSSVTPVPVSLPVAAVTLDAGSWHTCSITNDGNTYCWGENYNGRLGDGTDSTRASPALVAGAIQFVSVSTGYMQTCGLTNDGTAYCWGGNIYGEIGDSTQLEARPLPTPVYGSLRFESIFAGGGGCHGHTCGIVEDGTTYCWGRNYQRGVIPDPPQSGFNLIPAVLLGDPGFSIITVGSGAVCGIDMRGTLYCWGDDRQGQVGTGSDPRPAPTPIMLGQAFNSVSSGTVHACAVTSEGATYCWGSNTDGQLGNESNRMGWTVPVPVWKP
jgi:alpha-tubulin suppressor-like RCC1 family protein